MDNGLSREGTTEIPILGTGTGMMYCLDCRGFREHQSTLIWVKTYKTAKYSNRSRRQETKCLVCGKEDVINEKNYKVELGMKDQKKILNRRPRTV